MSSITLLAESNLLRAEAEALLEFTGIAGNLRKFGQPTLVGSYVYNVMLARDLDFHVVIDEFTPELATIFFAHAAESGLFEEIIFHDKHTFNQQAASRYASKKALDSYYFGLRLRFNDQDWQIGINFITKPQASSVDIGQLFVGATNSQREQILSFKKKMRDTGRKVSSAYIYRAVLEHGITNEESLFDYLTTVGYSGLS